MVPQNTPPEMARNSWPPDFWEEHTGSMSSMPRLLDPLDNWDLSSWHSCFTVWFLKFFCWSQNISLICNPCWWEISRPISSSRPSSLKSSQETDGLWTEGFFFLPPSRSSERKIINILIIIIIQQTGKNSSKFYFMCQKIHGDPLRSKTFTQAHVRSTTFSLIGPWIFLKRIVDTVMF